MSNLQPSGTMNTGEVITYKDAYRIIATLKTMYPDSFRNIKEQDDNWNNMVILWKNQLNREKFAADDVLNAVNYINATEDYTRMPTVAKVILQARVEKNKRLSGTNGARRIVTPEEDVANEFHEYKTRVENGTLKLDDTLPVYNMTVRQWLDKAMKYYVMFYGKEKDANYEKYFGKTREEFEKY